uniref:Phorbol-ester/DAG-type domain-containing protein n=1 Tax=Davidia involucrata TaxID=16924 RepID=A0A5B7BVG5_DAVIN
MIHASHPEHELELKNYEKPYKCDGCKEQGFGSRYRCEVCNYDLHEDCMQNDPTTSHKFFKGCTFKFFLQRLPRKCNKPYYDKCIRTWWVIHWVAVLCFIGSKCMWKLVR